ncbi:hypothetical protein CWI39_0187p0030 [Hamiltosporidium magnivora]|uniref:Uncharacterized protein n=1 Tax=Hamiltosporidium magnivora TaxID=148818 RepID=A0A4Q9LK46_9MICR|nr:hypothetical protein CWI39_0187p0030 [Hamiltosporidium magnivora]
MFSFHYCLNLIIFVFIRNSKQKDIIFYVAKENKEQISGLNNHESKNECICRIRRKFDGESTEAEAVEQISKRDTNVEYNQHTLYNIEKTEFKFETLDTINEDNQNIEIFLCHHVKESEFLNFHRFIVSNNSQEEESMTIVKFYNILYFLEYLRVTYEDILQKCLKKILFSLAEAKEIQDLDMDKISSHFPKQEIFSVEFCKILFQVYFENFFSKGKNIYSEFFKVEVETLEFTYEKLYTEDSMQCLIINEKIASFITQNLDNNLVNKNLFILLLNTFDVKYLHIENMKDVALEGYFFILENLKKNIDEIVFNNVSISDQLIRSLERNLNFRNLKKIVFLKSIYETKLQFSKEFSKGPKFIFFTGIVFKDEDLPTNSNVSENLNTCKRIIMNSKKGKIMNWLFPLKNVIPSRINVERKADNLYLSLFNLELSEEKIKIFDSLDLIYDNWRLNCYYELNGSFNYVFITFENFELKNFRISDSVLPENIRKIVIKNSKIHCNFLKTIFRIPKLKHLSIKESEIYMKNEFKIQSESIKHFFFQMKKEKGCQHFYKLIKLMVNLKEGHLSYCNYIELRFFKNQKIEVKELYIWDLNTEYFIGVPLKNSPLKSLSFKNNNLGFESSSGHLKLLFEKYNFSRIKKLYMMEFSIQASDSEAFGDLFYLKELTLQNIVFKNISFSQLFCSNKEYKIERLSFTKIHIDESALKFISKLSQLQFLRLDGCDVHSKASSYITFSSLKHLHIVLWDSNDDQWKKFIQHILKEFGAERITLH